MGLFRLFLHYSVTELSEAVRRVYFCNAFCGYIKMMQETKADDIFNHL